MYIPRNNSVDLISLAVANVRLPKSVSDRSLKPSSSSRYFGQCLRVFLSTRAPYPGHVRQRFMTLPIRASFDDLHTHTYAHYRSLQPRGRTVRPVIAMWN